jgi:hypothetical protein
MSTSALQKDPGINLKKKGWVIPRLLSRRRGLTQWSKAETLEGQDRQLPRDGQDSGVECIPEVNDQSSLISLGFQS